MSDCHKVQMIGGIRLLDLDVLSGRLDVKTI